MIGELAKETLRDKLNLTGFNIKNEEGIKDNKLLTSLLVFGLEVDRLQERSGEFRLSRRWKDQWSIRRWGFPQPLMLHAWRNLQETLGRHSTLHSTTYKTGD